MRQLNYLAKRAVVPAAVETGKQKRSESVFRHSHCVLFLYLALIVLRIDGSPNNIQLIEALLIHVYQ